MRGGTTIESQSLWKMCTDFTECAARAIFCLTGTIIVVGKSL